MYSYIGTNMYLNHKNENMFTSLSSKKKKKKNGKLN